MPRAPISQQTATAIPLQAELGRTAPEPELQKHFSFRGPLQWALEGPGWGVIRPTVDFVLLSAAAVLAFGGVSASVNASPRAAPLLGLPIVVVLLFYLRGLYRTRLRALVLDGVVPVLSAVSVGVMMVAVLGLFVNRSGP